MPDINPTLPDGAPVTLPTPGQTDYKAEYEKVSAQYNGLNGAFTQYRTKSLTDLEAAKQVAKQVEEQLSASKINAENLQTQVKELEPFRAQVTDLASQLQSVQKLKDKLNILMKYPALLHAADESGANPYLSLVESSVLEGEALEAQIKIIAGQLTSATGPNRTGATPPTPPKGAEATAAQMLDEAEGFRKDGKMNEYHTRMDQYYAQTEKERGKRFLPPLPKGSADTSPA